MKASVKKYCEDLIKSFDTIPAERKATLLRISEYIKAKQEAHLPIQLIYICTHNSRRSHFGQVWAQVASNYFGIKSVSTFSGGTQATAFNSHAIDALQKIGFDIRKLDATNNPIYELSYDEKENSILCFSKIYNHEKNPQQHFAAIMTCSEADENCPFIAGAALRINTSYEDPKLFDNTNLQAAKYDEKCRQIALETFYAFSNSIKQQVL